MTENLIYKIALSLIPGIGSITAKSLIAYTGSAEQVFREKENALRQIPGVGTILAKNIINSEVMSRAGREVEFLQKNNVKGDPFLNCPKVISIVGTRHATEYGRKIIDQFISVLAERGYKIIVVSGLAYGIDIHAHKSAIRAGIPTVAVMGHGLETVYPSMHTAIAKEMIENQGGLVSDFLSNSPIERTNFPVSYTHLTL